MPVGEVLGAWYRYARPADPEHEALVAKLKAGRAMAADLGDPLTKPYRCIPADPCGGCDLCASPDYYDCRCQLHEHPWCPVHRRGWNPDGPNAA